MIRSGLCAILAFSLFVVLHFLHFHFFFPTDKAASVIAMAIFGAFIYALLVTFFPNEEELCRRLRIPSKIVKVLPAIFGAIFYALLFIGYLEFYFTADRSITFRMLRIIDEQPQHALTSDEMLKAYDTNSIIIRRFDDLVYGGYLQKTGDNYSLTAKGQRTLAVYRFTIDYLHLGKF